MKWLRTTNRAGSVALERIPVADYADFHSSLCGLLEREGCHIVEYTAVPMDGALRFFALVADDQMGEVLIGSHTYTYYEERPLHAVTAVHEQAHPFERAIAELYGVRFEGNPWPKPLRYPAGGADKQATQDNHPFYTIDGTQLHEVNVGPIHAGVIEPGAFRFICNGERVLHLEIALGYQHRGVQPLMVAAKTPLQRVCLAESVVGDSAVTHAAAHAMVMEKLAAVEVPLALDAQRALAIELERMAMHMADIGALCGDVAYQLGQVACEALRTILINTTQRICGNRFGKGMVRPAGSRCEITAGLRAEIEHNVSEVSRRFSEVLADLKNSPTVLARFEECGRLTAAQAACIGAVGLAARSSGLPRDVRRSHVWGPWGATIPHTPVVREQGDVMSRLMVRAREVGQSAAYVLQLLEQCGPVPAPDLALGLQPGHLAFALVEGWRGEVCHTA
ncbi:MAG: NADH dehydrogenase subunit, partial [Rikenellaceae bacterium]|nr:NADH dehydrogenase subunit [Rikenellaceae bacterium]